MVMSRPASADTARKRPARLQRRSPAGDPCLPEYRDGDFGFRGMPQVGCNYRTSGGDLMQPTLPHVEVHPVDILDDTHRLKKSTAFGQLQR